MKSKFNQLVEKYSSELKMGVKIEREHRDTLNRIKKSIKGNRLSLTDQNVYTSIAKDHLKELPDYYTRLKKVEQKKSTTEEVDLYDINSLIEEKKKAKKKKKKKSKKTNKGSRRGYYGGGWGYWGGAGHHHNNDNDNDGDGDSDSGGDGGD